MKVCFRNLLSLNPSPLDYKDLSLSSMNAIKAASHPFKVRNPFISLLDLFENGNGSFDPVEFHDFCLKMAPFLLILSYIPEN